MAATPPPPFSSPTKSSDSPVTSHLSSALDLPVAIGGGGPSHAASDKEEVVPHEKAEEGAGKKAEEEESLLCVVLCDFLFDTPKVPADAWPDRMCNRAAAAFRRCRPDDELKEQKDGKTIDLRGEYISTAIPLFLRHLHETSIIASVDPCVRCLNVIVGCMKHGVGEGLLKNEVLMWLEKEEGVVTWDIINNGSVISIKLTGDEKFNFLKYDLEGY